MGTTYEFVYNHWIIFVIVVYVNQIIFVAIICWYLFAYSQETVSSLLDHMFSGEKTESVIVNGLSVIQALLEFRKIGYVQMQVQFCVYFSKYL